MIRYNNRLSNEAAARNVLPAFLCFLLVSILYLSLGDRAPMEIIFAPCLILAWAAARRFGWSERICQSILCGYLIALSGPGLGLGILAFAAFVPLFLALDEAESFSESLLCGLLAGATCAFLVFSWGPQTFANYCETGPLASYIFFLPFPFILSLKFPLFAILYYYNRKRLKVHQMLFLPPVFVALELLKVEMYPWYIAVTQVDSLRIIQVIDLIGLAGLSGIIVLVNVAARDCWNFLRRRARTFSWKEGVCCIAVLWLIVAYGEVRLRQVRSAESKARTLNVAAIQPNTPSVVENDDVRGKHIICDTLYALARESIRNCSPDVIVFAEGSAPMAYQYGGNPEFRDVYNQIAREFRVPVLTDNVHYINKHEYYRAALLLSADAEILGEYKKRTLVPFGEYVPFGKVFPFLKKLFHYTKTYGRGDAFPVLAVDGVQLAPQICFEIIHPRQVRKYVREGGQLLINMSDDAWYGDRKQARQHFELAALRCIENRVPMVRVTKTGISGFISATGAPVGSISPIGEAWTACQPVSIPSCTSFYRRFGDLFGWLCVVFIIGAVCFGLSGNLFCRRDR